MNSYENASIEIKKIENAFIVELGYKAEDKDNDFNSYNYEKYAFDTWDKVVEFIKDKEVKVVW